MTQMSEVERAVDNSAWDGNAAMTACTSASDYRAICAGRKAGDPELRSSWALPHHKRPGAPPNAAGVRAALQRFSATQGLTNRAEARAHLEAHMSAIQAQAASADPPRESLYRAIWPADFELRDSEEGLPVMFGHFAVFNRWAEIESAYEGHFMEQIDRGAFERTFDHRAQHIRVLFQHGKDPHVGSKVLGSVQELREDEHGAYYEVPLLDTSYNRDLLPGLREGLYGSSFRFRVTREQVDRKPARSEHNPDGLPERTIKEVELHEFGPVTFPAYEDATAGIRSLTDEFLLDSLVRDKDRLRQLIRYIGGEPSEADPAEASEPGTSADDGPAEGSVPGTPRRARKDYLTRKEVPSWTL